MNTVDDVKRAILATVEDYPDLYGVMFEGMMISTIKTTFYNYLMELKASHGIDPLFVILETDVQHCLKRIASRGTGKASLSEENVRSKCEMVMRHATYYDQSYVRHIKVDTIKPARMVWEFLKAVGDKELLIHDPDKHSNRHLQPAQ